MSDGEQSYEVFDRPKGEQLHEPSESSAPESSGGGGGYIILTASELKAELTERRRIRGAVLLLRLGKQARVSKALRDDLVEFGVNNRLIDAVDDALREMSNSIEETKDE